MSAIELTTALPDLRARLTGRVITPTDPEYDLARVVMPGGFDCHPAAILRPANAADVALGIQLARQTGLPFAIRSGGHSGAGHSTSEGGLVLDLREMKAIEIDVEQRTAWAETGLTAGEVTAATGAHGLAVGFGDTGSVGIGGITLGGGVGYLVRKYGLTIDNLLAVELVTAAGEVLQVDAEQHPDLFWALRGGGGNFGVATRFKYRLHPLPGIVGGYLFLPATPEIIAGFMAAAEAAPEELSCIINVMTAPPMPFLPEELVGQVIVMAMMVYAGEGEAAERALAPFRALAEPLADLLGPMKYSEMFPPEEGDYHPTAVSTNLHIERFGQAEAELILEHLNASDASLRAAQLRPLGGAMARVPAEATAYAHRQQRIMVNLAAFYDGAEDKARQTDWLEAFATALNQGDHSAYVNFINDEGPERVRDAYPPAHWARLAAVKAQYDPENFFKLNQNIPPA